MNALAATRTVPIYLGITDLDVGGAERMFVELATRLDRSRWSPTVFCVQPIGPLADRLQRENVPIVSLNVRSSLEAARAIGELSRKLREDRPRIVQTFLFHANLIGRWAARQATVLKPNSATNATMRVWRHKDSSAPMRGRDRADDKDGPLILSGQRVAEQRWRGHVLLDRLTRSWVDGHACVSQDVASFVRTHLRESDDRLAVIPNGVDLDAIDAHPPIDLEPWRLPQRSTVLLCLGRLDRQKGIDLLVDACRRVDALTSNGERLCVVFAGDGAMRSELEQSVKNWKGPSRLHVVGRTSDPIGWLKAVDGLVLASRWEGMPNVVLEAMAAGKPVISTRAEGVSELVMPGQTGWLVPKNDPESLARAIVEFIRCPPSGRVRMGELGRRRVKVQFSLATMVDGFQRWWTSMLAGRAD